MLTAAIMSFSVSFVSTIVSLFVLICFIYSIACYFFADFICSSYNFVYVKIFRVRKIFHTQIFAGFEVIFRLKLQFRKCVTYVAGCSFTKTCSLTGC